MRQARKQAYLDDAKKRKDILIESRRTDFEDAAAPGSGEAPMVVDTSPPTPAPPPIPAPSHANEIAKENVAPRPAQKIPPTPHMRLVKPSATQALAAARSAMRADRVKHAMGERRIALRKSHVKAKVKVVDLEPLVDPTSASIPRVPHTSAPASGSMVSGDAMSDGEGDKTAPANPEAGDDATFDDYWSMLVKDDDHDAGSHIKAVPGRAKARNGALAFV